VTGLMALNSTGDLFVWGRNKVAMSFNNTSVDISSATRVNSFIDSSNTPLVSRVWTGTHDDGDIFVQATNGLVYGTGLGFSLGINNSANNGWKQITFFNTTTRYLVELYTGCTDTSVQKATAFAITRDTTTNEYTLWATGYNQFGQLGTGSSGEVAGDIINWFEITFPSGLVKRIKRIISSSHGTRYSINTGNTYILLDSGEVYYSGKDIPLRNVDRIITPFQLLTVKYTPEYN
jgi:alpha-tubulin suppressor-like RCC1 family protein